MIETWLLLTFQHGFSSCHALSSGCTELPGVPDTALTFLELDALEHAVSLLGLFFPLLSMWLTPTHPSGISSKLGQALPPPSFPVPAHRQGNTKHAFPSLSLDNGSLRAGITSSFGHPSLEQEQGFSTSTLLTRTSCLICRTQYQTKIQRPLFKSY